MVVALGQIRQGCAKNAAHISTIFRLVLGGTGRQFYVIYRKFQATNKPSEPSQWKCNLGLHCMFIGNQRVLAYKRKNSIVPFGKALTAWAKQSIQQDKSLPHAFGWHLARSSANERPVADRLPGTCLNASSITTKGFAT